MGRWRRPRSGNGGGGHRLEAAPAGSIAHGGPALVRLDDPAPVRLSDPPNTAPAPETRVPHGAEVRYARFAFVG